MKRREAGWLPAMLVLCAAAVAIGLQACNFDLESVNRPMGNTGGAGGTGGTSGAGGMSGAGGTGGMSGTGGTGGVDAAVDRPSIDAPGDAPGDAPRDAPGGTGAMGGAGGVGGAGGIGGIGGTGGPPPDAGRDGPSCLMPGQSCTISVRGPVGPRAGGTSGCCPGLNCINSVCRVNPCDTTACTVNDFCCPCDGTCYPVTCGSCCMLCTYQ